ncbi:MAG: DUF1289 domain-containing protein [Candidatus Reddybacter sp.]
MGNKSSAGECKRDAEEAPVVSPCVAICALDMNDICTGCHRSGGEIREWMSLDSTERRAVLKKVHARGKVGNPFA